MFEAVTFFDGQNIPLSYFIKGCEEAKSMLSTEAESQFIKIIRTKIVCSTSYKIKSLTV